MNSRQLAETVTRLVGVYALLQGVWSVSTLGWVLQLEDSQWYLVLFAVLPPVIFFSVGLALLFAGSRFSALLVPPSGSSEADRISSRDLQAISFSVVGLVLCVTAIPKLVQIGMNLSVVAAESASPGNRITASATPHIVGLIVQIGIGIAVFVGAKGLSLLWNRMRAAEHPM